MTDIVTRLRNPPFGTETSERNLMTTAADEIERLRQPVQPPASVKPTVEQVARAICRGRGLNPDCQNQGSARDGSVDGNWPEPRENFGRPYDTRWYYGWRNQVEAAKAVLDLLDSLPQAPANALLRACTAMVDDYQTSEQHHPDHVLVPLAAFNAMRGALAPVRKPMTMLVDREWLREKIETDPDDGECLAGSPAPSIQPTASADGVTHSDLDVASVAPVGSSATCEQPEGTHPSAFEPSAQRSSTEPHLACSAIDEQAPQSAQLGRSEGAATPLVNDAQTRNGPQGQPTASVEARRIKQLEEYRDQLEYALGDANQRADDAEAKLASLTPAPTREDGELRLQKRPVEFRVLAHGNWLHFEDEQMAQESADMHGVDYQGLYVRDGSPLSTGGVREGLSLGAQLNNAALTIRRIKDAYEKARYQPGDHPILPHKLDTLMKELDSALSSPATPEPAETIARLAEELGCENDAATVFRSALSLAKTTTTPGMPTGLPYDWVDDNNPAPAPANGEVVRAAIPAHEGWRYGELIYNALYAAKGGLWHAVSDRDKQAVWYPAGYRFAVDAALSNPAHGHAEAVPVRRVRHKKRGSTYEVFGEAEAQVSTGADGRPISLGLVRQRILVEGSKLTVYRDSKKGRLFVRFPDEFEDGRFEEVAHPAGEKVGE